MSRLRAEKSDIEDARSKSRISQRAGYTLAKCCWWWAASQKLEADGWASKRGWEFAPGKSKKVSRLQSNRSGKFFWRDSRWEQKGPAHSGKCWGSPSSGACHPCNIAGVRAYVLSWAPCTVQFSVPITTVLCSSIGPSVCGIQQAQKYISLQHKLPSSHGCYQLDLLRRLASFLCPLP